MLSLRYEDHLYAKLFHNLISLHHHDQVICWVWWKHGLEIRIRSNTWRASQWRWLEGGFICFSEARVKEWSKWVWWMPRKKKMYFRFANSGHRKHNVWWECVCDLQQRLDILLLSHHHHSNKFYLCLKHDHMHTQKFNKTNQ